MCKSRQGTSSSKIKGSILNNKDYHKEANHKNANNERKGLKNLEVKTRWKENYEEHYNKRNPVDEETANTIPQMYNTDQEPEIIREEIVSAINKMADGKSPEFNGITAQETKHVKAAGEIGIDILHHLGHRIWTHETFPDDCMGELRPSLPHIQKTNWTAAIIEESAYSVMLARYWPSSLKDAF